jgi:hypothetical protein
LINITQINAYVIINIYIKKQTQLIMTNNRFHGFFN